MAAENNVKAAADELRSVVASMRPRRMAAENGGEVRLDRETERASMRPRRMAAENIVIPEELHSSHQGFNEAAANGRGKPYQSPST